MNKNEYITLYGRLFNGEKCSYGGNRIKIKNYNTYTTNLRSVACEQNLITNHNYDERENIRIALNCVVDKIKKDYLMKSFSKLDEFIEINTKKSKNGETFNMSYHMNNEEKDAFKEYINNVITLVSYFKTKYIYEVDDIIFSGSLYFNLDDAISDNIGDFSGFMNRSGFSDKYRYLEKYNYGQKYFYDRTNTFTETPNYYLKSFTFFKFDIPKKFLKEKDLEFSYKVISLMNCVHPNHYNRKIKNSGIYRIIRKIKLESKKDINFMEDYRMNNLFPIKNFEVIDINKNRLYLKLKNMFMDKYEQEKKAELLDFYIPINICTSFGKFNFYENTRYIKEYSEEKDYLFYSYKELKKSYKNILKNLSGRKKTYYENSINLYNDDEIRNTVKNKLIENNFDILKIINIYGKEKEKEL